MQYNYRPENEYALADDEYITSMKYIIEKFTNIKTEGSPGVEDRAIIKARELSGFKFLNGDDLPSVPTAYDVKITVRNANSNAVVSTECKSITFYPKQNVTYNIDRTNLYTQILGTSLQYYTEVNQNIRLDLSHTNYIAGTSYAINSPIYYVKLSKDFIFNPTKTILTYSDYTQEKVGELGNYTYTESGDYNLLVVRPNKKITLQGSERTSQSLSLYSVLNHNAPAMTQFVKEYYVDVKPISDDDSTRLSLGYHSATKPSTSTISIDSSATGTFVKFDG